MVNGVGNTGAYVDAPPTTPMPFGLFSAATVKDDAAPLRWLRDGITWEPAYCGPAFETVAACTEDAPDLELVDGIDAVQASAFTAYHLFQCRLPAGVWDEGEDRAREALRLGEQRAAEAHLVSTIARATDVDGETEVEDVTPTPGTAVHPVTGLGLLHQYAAAVYGGTPVIHTPPVAGVLLRAYGAVERVGTALQTAIGAPVSVGGGYGLGYAPEADPLEPLVVAADGTAWLYATGQVMVRRAATTDVQRTLAGSMQRNEFVALASRPYVIGWECFTAAVLVDTTYGIPLT